MHRRDSLRSLTIGPKGTSNATVNGPWFKDLEGTWGYTLTPVPADGWRFHGWQGRSWSQRSWPCGSGQSCHVWSLRCTGADEGHWLASPLPPNTPVTCGFGVHVGAWHGLRAIFVDNRDPETSITGGHVRAQPWAAPRELADRGRTGPNETVSWSFREPADVAEGSTFKCRIDLGPEQDCWSGKPWSNADYVDGEHTFSVWAVDPSGRSDETPASVRWYVDHKPPTTHLEPSSLPPASTSDPSWSIGFHATHDDGGSGGSFVCQLDAGPWLPCTSGQPRTFPEGDHTFRVRARDEFGNEDESAAEHAFTIDQRPPETSLTGGPAQDSITGATSAQFTFGSDDAGSEFECRVNGQPAGFGTCSGPGAAHRVDGLGSGEHRFEVRARDSNGNLDPSPERRTWIVDATPPETEITERPLSGATLFDRAASFAFASEPGAAFECSLDGGPFQGCTGPAAGHRLTGLSEAVHVLGVRALDAVGNADPTPSTRTWTVRRRLLALDGAALRGKGKRSKLERGATLTLSGRLESDRATGISVRVANQRAPSQAVTLATTIAPGAFTATLPLPRSARRGAARLVPGAHAIDVRAETDGEALTASRAARLAAPKEGVVMSATIDSTPRKVSASFAFAPEALPAKRLKAIWIDPRGKRVGRYEVKAPNATTFFAWLDNRRLQKGRWRCRVKMRGKLVTAVSIRLR